MTCLLHDTESLSKLFAVLRTDQFEDSLSLGTVLGDIVNAEHSVVKADLAAARARLAEAEERIRCLEDTLNSQNSVSQQWGNGGTQSFGGSEAVCGKRKRETLNARDESIVWCLAKEYAKGNLTECRRLKALCPESFFQYVRVGFCIVRNRPFLFHINNSPLFAGPSW